MAFKRSYDDGCAAAHALDLVGERWALLVVRELAFGSRRFTDLRAGLPGISPNVLTQRLDELEQAAVVRRRRLLPPAATWVYELTAWGQELVPMLIALGRWGARSPLMAQGLPVSAASLMLSLRTMFDAEAAGDLSATVGFEFGHDRYQAVVGKGRLRVERGEPAAPDAVVAGEPQALAAVIYGGHKLAEAQRLGELVVRGDKGVVRRLVALFPLPQPAPVAAERAVQGA
ncbi:MAG: transcriptional regulator [Rhizobacter sp.]|nr:transcriptional regulator [Rhizobacter sp.]